jgi:hypothetical protein
VGQWAGVQLSQRARGPVGGWESGEGHPGCWGAGHREVSGLEQGHDHEPELEPEEEEDDGLHFAAKRPCAEGEGKLANPIH